MLKREALQILEQKIAGCTKCEELTEYRRANNYRTVPGNGNPAARVFVLGEAPGENEAKQGVPFCGKAGNLLNNILKAAGLSRDDVFVTNVLKCRPPGNRDPEKCEADNCRKYLDMQLKCVNPEWIVCFGRIASVNLLGKEPDTTIGSLRGVVHEYNGRKVICTYHPSYILQCPTDEKQTAAKKAVWEDLQPLLCALRESQTSV